MENAKRGRMHAIVPTQTPASQWWWRSQNLACDALRMGKHALLVTEIVKHSCGEGTVGKQMLLDSLARTIP